MATLSESLALSSLSNLRPSLSPSLTSPPSISLSAHRKLTALPQFSGLRIQLPSHRPVSSFSSRNPSVLRRCARVSCEAQETALDSKFFSLKKNIPLLYKILNFIHALFIYALIFIWALRLFRFLGFG